MNQLPSDLPVDRTVDPERMALLHTLALTASRLCMQEYDAFISRLLESLAAQAGQNEGMSNADVFQQAAEHLKQHHATFHHLLGECLERALLQAVQDVGEYVAAGLKSGAMDLSLDTFDVMERKVLIDNLSQTLDALNTESLGVLSLRLAHWLQAEEICPAHNPFRSETFLNAVSEAWSRFHVDTASHRLMLRQLRPEVFLPLEPVLQALNQELVAHDVLPDAEHLYEARKSAPETVPPPSDQEALRQWLAPEDAQNMAEARVIALLEKTLAHLSNEAELPVYAGSLLVRLQPEVQKTVLADKDFFFNDGHAARRLISALINAGLGCDVEKAGDDPLYQAIEQLCARVGGQGDLAEVAGELEALIASEDRKLNDSLQQSATEAIAQENWAQAKQMAEQEVMARIESGEVTGFIETFLQIQWTRVLAFAYSVRDTRPEILPMMLKAMDDLIQSVQPKGSPEERKEFIDSLPTLLAVLNAWLNVVKWSGPERESFFSALAERHTIAMRAPVELSPRDQLELRMNMVQKASEHHLNRRAQEQKEEAIAEFMRQIDTLNPGNWLRFVRNNGGKLNCRLLWISPGRSRFIFSGRQGDLLFTLDDYALAQAMQADRVSVIPTGQMIENALMAALRELGVG